MKYLVMKLTLAAAALAATLGALFAGWSALTFWNVNPMVATGSLYSATSMFCLAALCEGCRAVINRFDD